MKRDDMLTMGDASKELGVTRSRFHQICKEMQAKVERLTPRFSMISRKELERIKENRSASAAT